jgi:hypothetical protein
MISIAYIQSAADFIADKVFPMVPVTKQSDRYFVYTQDYWFRTGAQKRAPASESAGGGFAISNTPSYYCDVWAFHHDVDDQIRANADEPLDVDRDATKFVTQNLLIRREISWINTYMQPSIWTGNPSGDVTPTNLWDSASGNPMQDIDTQKQTIKSQTGFLPNVLVLTADVYYAIRNNAAVLDRIKYTQTGIVDTALLAMLFGVEKVLVASAVLNSAAEGATASYAYMKTNAALLVYANPAPSLMQPSGGYIFSWRGLFGAGALGTRIMTFRREKLKADRVEGEMAYSMNLVGANLGVYFLNPIS